MKKFKEILFLKSIKGVGKSAIYNKYFDALASADGVEELIDLVASDPKFSESDLEAAAKKAEAWFYNITENSDLKVLTVFDKDYPKKLNVLGKKRPLCLYVRGNVSALAKSNIAVVGTRNPSEWSTIVEERLVKKILEISDRAIVSGLAQGCDYIAHNTTVKSGKTTIAVLPSGVNVITPPSHKALADDIVESGGCIVSEYDPDAIAFKPSYPERDAVIAALSDITLAVECGVTSGTMYTVEAAYSFSRPICCYYPDDLSKGNYEGNAFMVRNKNAVKISNTDDLISLLSKPVDNSSEDDPTQLSLKI